LQSTLIREMLEEIEGYARGGEGEGGDVVEEGNRLVTFDEQGWKAIGDAKEMLIKDAQ